MFRRILLLICLGVLVVTWQPTAALAENYFNSKPVTVVLATNYDIPEQKELYTEIKRRFMFPKYEVAPMVTVDSFSQVLTESELKKMAQDHKADVLAVFNIRSLYQRMITSMWFMEEDFLQVEVYMDIYLYDRELDKAVIKKVRYRDVEPYLTAPKAMEVAREQTRLSIEKFVTMRSK